MKRFILLPIIAVCLALPVCSSAQPVVGKVTRALPKVDLGIKVGANFGQITGNTWEQSYKPGILAGAVLGVHKGKIGVQAEVLLNTSHYTSKGLFDSVNKGDFRATYLDVPVMFEYKVIGGKLLPKLWLMAGPQFSSLMSVSSLNNYAGATSSLFKSANVSGVIGAEVRFLKLSVGVRYIVGFSSMNKTSIAGASEAWNTRSVQLSAGFRFL